MSTGKKNDIIFENSGKWQAIGQMAPIADISVNKELKSCRMSKKNWFGSSCISFMLFLN